MSEVVVYTAGVFDMFHLGHLNLLRMARGLGDRLIVAVSPDDVVEAYKPGRLVMAYEDRAEIVAAIRHVDVVVPQRDRNKVAAWDMFKYDILAIGDDWRGKPECMTWETQLAERGAKVVYLPYTGSISSTKLRARLR